MHINTMSLDVLWVVQPPARSNHPSIFSVVLKKLYDNDNDMGVSKNKGTPKWMVYNGKPY